MGGEKGHEGARLRIDILAYKKGSVSTYAPETTDEKNFTTIFPEGAPRIRFFLSRDWFVGMWTRLLQNKKCLQ